MKPGQTEGAASGPAPFLYLLTTMALFGAAFPSSKVVVGQVPHEVAASLRFAGGAAILILLLCLRPGGSRFTGRDLRRAGTVGLIGVAAYNSLYFWGVSLAPAIDGSVIVPVLSPVLTTLISLVTGREPSSAPRLAGLALAVAGAAVFFVGIAQAGDGLTGTRVAGDAIFLAAAACWAAYSIASQRVLKGIDPLRATTYASAVGAVVLTLAAAPSMRHAAWGSISTGAWLNLAFLAVGPTAIAYLFYARGLRAVGPVVATTTMFAVPVFGALASILFLGETCTALQGVGAVVAIGGALLAVTEGRVPGRTPRDFQSSPAPQT